MRRFLGWSVAFCFAGAFLLSGVGRGQAWKVVGGDIAHNNGQKAETRITVETVARDFKFLWKIKLGNKPAKSQSFGEPLLFPDLISSRGFKDMALWAGSNTLYAVDSDLGTLIWQKRFNVQSPRAHGACGGSNIQIVMEAPRIIHFGAHVASPASPPPSSFSDPRRIGFLGSIGIYVLTPDGYLHEQNLVTGLDFAPPVKFLPARDGDFSMLNMDGKVVYTVTGGGCRNVPNAAWSIDLNTPDYLVNSYETPGLSPLGLTGPAIAPDGTVYVVTGAGHSDPSAGVYANSVVALTPKDLKVKDWFIRSNSDKARILDAGPVVFTYEDKQLIAAAGNDGTIVLSDGAFLGGRDHQTPLAQTDKIVEAAKSGWDGLASFQDKNGTFWVLASISGPVKPDVKFANANGPAPHGSIIAFKVEEIDGRPALTPSWISRDLRNPAPPAIANGVVFALAGGDASKHAMLYALDAATGRELYSSRDTIETYTHLAGMSVGDGHVFFTTHDNTLYSFGIPMEH